MSTFFFKKNKAQLDAQLPPSPGQMATYGRNTMLLMSSGPGPRGPAQPDPIFGRAGPGQANPHNSSLVCRSWPNKHFEPILIII